MSEPHEVNPLRADMVRNIIGQNPNVALTVEALSEFFPPDFDLGDDDLQNYLGEQAPKPKATPLSEIEFEGETPAPEAEAATAEPTPAPVVEAEPEPEPITPEMIADATARRLQADQDLANRRVDLLKAQGVERVAREKLAKAVAAFQSGFAPITPEQLRRQHVKEQAEIRQAQKDGLLPMPPRPGHGKSVVDRMAFYSRGGSPASGNYRRGAYPSQMKGGPNRDARRGPVAKLPSEL